MKTVRWTPTGLYQALCARQVRRTAYVVLALLFALAAMLAMAGEAADPLGGFPQRVRLSVAGSAQVVHDTVVKGYSLDDMDKALWLDVPFAITWALMLALAVPLAGRNYRTVSTRRWVGPLVLAALSAGALNVAADLVMLAQIHHVIAFGWPLSAILSWGCYLLLIGLVGYIVGGAASRLVGSTVIDVLHEADDPDEQPTPYSSREGRLGLAFSGGGIRAASISLGALQALDDGEGRLGWRAADRVTAVSGGSYMTGAWSVSRTAGRFRKDEPLPWDDEDDGRPGPEERHLRANLGYLLSNTPRRTIRDTMTSKADRAKLDQAERTPGVLATVVTGIVFNSFVFLALLWTASQLLGWVYRWYYTLTCPGWGESVRLDFAANHACLVQSARPGWPVFGWAVAGVVSMVVWILLAKGLEVQGKAPAAWLMVPKYVGYSGLAIAASLAVMLAVVPALMDLLWGPLSANSVLTHLVALVGGLGSGSAVLRLLRRPLANFAPVIGGVLFGAALGYVGILWMLDGMIADPDHRRVPVMAAFIVGLLLLHFLGTIEFWSLAAFYRGRIRAAFATYRRRPGGELEANAYANGGASRAGVVPEPLLSSLDQRGPGGQGTPLTVCASATVTGRGVRTHAGIPALSVTFDPRHVRVFAPLDGDGRWKRYECTTADIETLVRKNRWPWTGWRPRLTTMYTVALSGAAVSPAMGRFRIGPISMLLAFFNVRLGLWIPNPRYASELAERGVALPRPGLGYLLKEFIGFHDPSDLYLYVTDGGHWENTGLVELLRTRMLDEIVCVDADSGPGNTAKSISKAVDLAQLECAADVSLNLDVLRSAPMPTPGNDYSRRSINLGLVRQRIDGRERLSLLWYCKPALTTDMPPQLLAYREVDPTFPRVSTVNQFFHVAQFAAYRELGRYNARMIQRARLVLAERVAEHPTYQSFRLSGAAPENAPEPGEAGEAVGEYPAERWVLDELINLVEQLGRSRPGEVDYEEWAYAEVRRILAAGGSAPAPASATTAAPRPRSGASRSDDGLATTPRVR